MRGHIRKRGNKWAVVVDVGVGEDGRRKQRWHSGYDRRKDAQAALTEILSKIQKGDYVEPSKETLASFLREWLGSKTLRPSTRDSYQTNIEIHILPALGTATLQSLTPLRLNAFYADLLESGRADGRGGLSPKTVLHCHQVLTTALGDAVKWNKLARNPCDRAQRPRPAGHPEMKTWPAATLRAFLEGVSEDRLCAAWHLAAATGMRRGEVLGGRWQDLDLDIGRFAVRQTLTTVRYRLIFGAPKTDKGRRLVALDERTVAELKRHRTAQLQERLAFGPGYYDADLIFAREDGSPVHPDLFSDSFEKHAKRLGLPRIRLHDLRHTHATLALQAGVNPKVLSERLGHATVAFTLDRYAHCIPAMEEEAAERVAAVVFGA